MRIPALDPVVLHRDPREAPLCLCLHAQHPCQVAASCSRCDDHTVCPLRCCSVACALTGSDASAFSYILAPAALAVGDAVRSGPAAAIRPGNALPLINIPVGQAIHNIELKPGAGGQLARAAGTSAVLASKGALVTKLAPPPYDASS